MSFTTDPNTTASASQRSRTVTTDHSWTAKDLCPHCAYYDLNSILKHTTVIKWDASLEIPSETLYPLCQFFLSCVKDDRYESGSTQEIELEQSPGYPNLSRSLSVSLWDDRDEVSGAVISVENGPSLELPVLDVRRLCADSFAFAMIKNWIEQCLDEHTLCRIFPKGVTESKLPSNMELKAIDCTTKGIIDAPPDCDYVALSYVWGSDVDISERSLVGTSSQMASTKGLPHTLPRSIEDALHVVLQLGLRYLWVDKYCFDPSSAHDMNIQLSFMNEIRTYIRGNVVVLRCIVPEHD
jgi:hypothetical protein